MWKRLDERPSAEPDPPLSFCPEDYPPEELTPELRALVAMALLSLVTLDVGAGYAAVRVTRWLL